MSDLAALALEALGSRMRDQGRYALVDFPSHSNVGDSAIWLGELAALRALGLGQPGYVCDAASFSAAALRDRIGEGPILIHGGGNLGDLWERHQLFREEVVRRAPNNPIIQLPQSLEFIDPRRADRARAVFESHPDLTLFVRDERSLRRARGSFDVEVVLCPDLAFCLDDLPRAQAASRPLLWLLRTDHEAAIEGRASEGAPPVDWLDEDDSGWILLSRRLARSARVHGPAGGLFQPLLRFVWERAARQRVARGTGLLTSADVVVTDRLHAHILCLLMGVPHVVLPDRYGKIVSFIETWTRDADDFALAGSLDEAAALAKGLIDRRRGPEASHE